MVAAITAVTAAAGSAYSANQNKKAAKAGATSTQSLDPRAANILYGNNENGLLKFFEQFAYAPQSGAMQSYGNTTDNYLKNYAGADTESIRNAGYGILGNGGQQAAQSQSVVQPYGTGGVAQIGSTKVQAPGQNNMNLSSSFDRFINGDAGNNPHLLSSLQAGINATNAGFAKNQTDVTNNLQRNVLPGIRSSAIGAGQFGGSRQAIVESNALSDYTNQLTSANTQLGLANSANTTAQQANAFNQGQDRALNATLNLSGQQYNTASQNAAMDMQAQLANQAADNRAREYNATAQTNAAMSNQQNNQFNAGLQMQQRNMNNASLATGAGLLSGSLGTALAGSTGAQNYGLSQAQGASGLLAPYLGMGGSTTSTQPYYGSTAGSAIGGALGGLSLYNQFGGMGGAGGNGGASAYSGAGNNWGVQPGTAPVNTSQFGVFSGFGQG